MWVSGVARRAGPPPQSKMFVPLPKRNARPQYAELAERYSSAVFIGSSFAPSNKPSRFLSLGGCKDTDFLLPVAANTTKLSREKNLHFRGLFDKTGLRFRPN